MPAKEDCGDNRAAVSHFGRSDTGLNLDCRLFILVYFFWRDFCIN
jgi:hypothetical protein